MATGTDLLTLDEPPGTGAVGADFVLFGKSPSIPGKEFRVPAARLPGADADPGSIRDPFDVPTAKRKAVVDANTPALLESNTDYYGCEFVDEVYGPSQPAYYICRPSAPTSPGGATVWKWFRLDIL